MTAPDRDKVLNADPGFRRRMLALLALLVAAGAAALTGTDAYLRHVRELGAADPGAAVARVTLLFRGWMLVTALVPLLAGIYLARLGWRARLHGEFPPPGTRVLRETAVITGPGGRRLASLTWLLGMLLALAGLILAVFGWWMAGALSGSAAG